MYRRSVFVAAALVVCSASAQAELVRVTATGVVGFNDIGGSMTSVQPGDPVVMSFLVDSTNFVDSPAFPVRGYPIDLESFAMTVGTVPVPIVIPQPGGKTAYFVLRNNDPVVDGFVVSTILAIPQPVAVEIIGLAPIHDLNYLSTFRTGDVLSSLDILDALGTYTRIQLSVSGWTIGQGSTVGAEYQFSTISLTGVTVVPEPSSLLLAVLGGLGTGLCLLRRRLRSRGQGEGKKEDIVDCRAEPSAAADRRSTSSFVA